MGWYVVAVLDERIAHANKACALRQCDEIEQHPNNNARLWRWANTDALNAGLRGDYREFQDWRPCGCYLKGWSDE